MLTFVRKHRKLVPRPIIVAGKKAIFLLVDMLDKVSRRRPGLPPRRLMWQAGDGDFEAIGNEFLQYFVRLCGLRPYESVLDVGCGAGRMALPLATYLDGKARYVGMDVAKESVRWCTENIGSRFPNFEFRHIDVFNRKYNPTGKIGGSDYSFPFEDCSFDLVFLTSVFTHMLPPEVTNYIGEMARVLKAGGRCLVTFFLLNEEADQLCRSGRSQVPFLYCYDGYSTQDVRDPELAVAYQESYVRKQFERHGLRIREPVCFGSWAGRKTFTSYQDIIIARKAEAHDLSLTEDSVTGE
jgi:SAM-dependent methyltransferase